MCVIFIGEEVACIFISVITRIIVGVSHQGHSVTEDNKGKSWLTVVVVNIN